MSGHHALFAKTYDQKSKKIQCLNSWGEKDPKPSIDLLKVKNFYRVTCVAKIQKGSRTANKQTSIQQSRPDPKLLEEIRKNWSKSSYYPPYSEVEKAAKLASG